MNERIKQLSDIAYANHLKNNPNSSFGRRSDYDREFAELIVEEFVEQLRYTVLDTQELRRDKSTDYQVGWEDGMFDAEEMIREHFGVEE